MESCKEKGGKVSKKKNKREGKNQLMRKRDGKDCGGVCNKNSQVT